MTIAYIQYETLIPKRIRVQDIVYNLNRSTYFAGAGVALLRT
jgi:hypothetical protein